MALMCYYRTVCSLKIRMYNSCVKLAYGGTELIVWRQKRSRSANVYNVPVADMHIHCRAKAGNMGSVTSG
jgi:hypothetical protein